MKILKRCLNLEGKELEQELKVSTLDGPDGLYVHCPYCEPELWVQIRTFFDHCRKLHSPTRN